VDVIGAGCVGSGGPLTLAATGLPWIGAPLRSAASGLPANGLAVAVLGAAATPMPLAAVHPLGGPGCQLLVAAHLLVLAVPAQGTVAFAVDVPHAPALVGAVLSQQVIALDLGSGASLQAVTSTNAITATFGAF
jgi:hypothetical protein